MRESTKAISPLRQRMIEDMTLRKLNPRTQIAYIRAVANFTRFLGRSPDTAEAEDLRRYQLHMVEQGTSSTTLNATSEVLLRSDLRPPRGDEEDAPRLPTTEVAGDLEP